jgi:hypothetical protein
MIIPLKNTAFPLDTSPTEVFIGDIISPEEKLFLDLLSNIIVEDILETIKKNENAD